MLGVDGDDGVAVDVEERRRIPERRQVQTAAGPASKRSRARVTKGRAILGDHT